MKKLIYIATFLLFNHNLTYSQLPGDFDVSFGTNGKILHSAPIYSNGILGIAIQNDGRILAVGSKNYLKYFVMRLNSDGSIDNTFGSGGIVEDSLLGEAWGHDVKIDVTGKILITGYTRYWNAGWLEDMFVARLLQDGSYDNTFGNNGIFVANTSQPNPPTQRSYGKKIIPLLDGSILIGGTFDYGTSVNPDFAVFKITPSGQFDYSFGVNGYAYFDVSGTDALTEIFIQGDGRILLTGKTFNPVIVPIIRINTDGSLDNSFGTNGIKLIDFGTACQSGISISQVENGKILLSGSRGPCANQDLFVSRLDSNGQVDISFGNNGFSFFDNGNSEAMRSMVVFPDKNIILTGTSGTDILLVCFDSVGSINSSFANTGSLIVDFSGNNDNAWCSIMQTDGKLLISGMSTDIPNNLNYYPFVRLYSTFTSISEVISENITASVFPNPANNYFNLEFSPQINLPDVYEIIDLYGKTIVKGKIISQNTKINIEQLPSSVYLLQIKRKGEIIGSKKISINH
jgi:uncharacterized delta-60 repeat protein